MKIVPIQRKSIAESIAEQLRRKIFAGKFDPGTRLPPERELAENLGTNRNTLREAIRGLESLGLVRARQGDGVRVQDFRRYGEINLLPYYLKEHILDAEALELLEDMLQMRRTLLALAAARAASRMEGEVLLDLRRLYTLQTSDNRDDADRARTDIAFFSRLVDASGSIVMRWLFNSFVPIYDQVLETFPQLWIIPEGYLEFLDSLVTAVETGHGEKAHAIVLRHFQQTDPRILEIARFLAQSLQQPLGQLLSDNRG